MSSKHHPPTQYTLGTDEAGYGPNLGPLVISATLWRETPDGRAEDWSDLLADSKKLYAAHGSLAKLENGVLAGLAAVNRPVTTWQELKSGAIDPCSDGLNELPPWEKDFNPALPLDADPNILPAIADRLASRLLTLKSRRIHAETFNSLLDRDKLKSTLLTRQTLALTRNVIASLPDEAVATVYSDKHGGRNAYAAPLYEAFPEAVIEIIAESREISSYRIVDGGRRIDWHFAARGESRHETALASMLSKYLRELSMKAFNRFWQSQVPNLAPTAGYPVDAKRFWEAIDPIRQKLGLVADAVWRRK